MRTRHDSVGDSGCITRNSIPYCDVRIRWERVGHELQAERHDGLAGRDTRTGCLSLGGTAGGADCVNAGAATVCAQGEVTGGGPTAPKAGPVYPIRVSTTGTATAAVSASSSTPVDRMVAASGSAVAESAAGAAAPGGAAASGPDDNNALKSAPTTQLNRPTKESQHDEETLAA